MLKQLNPENELIVELDRTLDSCVDGIPTHVQLDLSAQINRSLALLALEATKEQGPRVSPDQTIQENVGAAIGSVANTPGAERATNGAGPQESIGKSVEKVNQNTVQGRVSEILAGALVLFDKLESARRSEKTRMEQVREGLAVEQVGASVLPNIERNIMPAIARALLDARRLMPEVAELWNDEDGDVLKALKREYTYLESLVQPHHYPPQ